MSDNQKKSVPKRAATPTKKPRGKPSSDLATLLGEPALLMGERKQDYLALQKKIEAVIVPRDYIEIIFVRDLTDLTWKILRLRRLEPAIIHSAHGVAIYNLMEAITGDDQEALSASRAWESGNKETREAMPGYLQERGYSADDLNARAIALMSPILEMLERIGANSEIRRNEILRQIERRREMIIVNEPDEEPEIIQAEQISDTPEETPTEQSPTVLYRHKRQ